MVFVLNAAAAHLNRNPCLHVFDEPRWQLCGKVNLFSITILQRSSHKRFTHFVMVRPGRIYIVHTVVNGVTQNFGGFASLIFPLVLQENAYIQSRE